MAFTAHRSGIRVRAEQSLSALSTNLFLEAYFYFMPDYKFAKTTRHKLKILSSCFQRQIR